MSNPYAARFVTSAAEARQLPPDRGREVAFAGRSNAGKSTAINAITGRRALARVSRTPGRTQLINFFELAPDRRIVDLPGYGFAKVPQALRERWLALTRRYFDARESLVGLMLIVDSRRGILPMDVAMLDWVRARGRPAHVLLAKADKLGHQARINALRAARTACEDAAVTVQLFSAPERLGLDDARAVLDAWLNA